MLTKIFYIRYAINFFQQAASNDTLCIVEFPFLYKHVSRSTCRNSTKKKQMEQQFLKISNRRLITVFCIDIEEFIFKVTF